MAVALVWKRKQRLNIKMGLVLNIHCSILQSALYYTATKTATKTKTKTKTKTYAL